MHEHGCPLIFAWQYCQAFSASILFRLLSSEIEKENIVQAKIFIDEASAYAYLVIRANEGANMKAEDKKFYEAKAAVLKALAHPTRLWMVEQLEAGEKCVCEFAEVIDADFSTVSKHLNVLKQAGIVADEKRGKQVYYSLKVPCVLNFMHCVEAVLSARALDHLSMTGLSDRPQIK
jgi:ArsR family transcriptional regulator